MSNLTNQSLHQTLALPYGSPPATMATSGDAGTTSKFQSLPAELRNRIYRETFNLDEPVTITSNVFPEPALLSVCKQLRKEASPIFYGEREFLIDASNFITDPTLLFKQKRVIVAKIFKIEMSRQTITPTGDSRNWPNVLIALSRAHKGHALGAVPHGIRPKEVSVKTLSAAFATAKALRGLPWHQVEPILEGYHGILVAHDRKWA